MNSKKTALLTLFLGLLATPQALFANDWLVSCPQGQDLAAWCQKNLENKERELQTELFTLVKIDSQEEWSQAKKDLSTDYETICATSTAQEFAHKPLPAELIAPINNVLNNQKIKALLQITSIEHSKNNMYVKAHRANGQTITIARGNHKIQADAATDQYTTLLYPEELLKTHATPAEIEATLAHELMHIAHEDDLNIYCLNQICAAKKNSSRIPKRKFARIKGQWERLQEERADIFAGLINLEYAQASTEQFKRNISPHQKLKPTSTHPTEHDRYMYMNNLTAEMTTRTSKAPQTSPLWILILGLITLIGSAYFVIQTKKVNS